MIPTFLFLFYSLVISSLDSYFLPKSHNPQKPHNSYDSSQITVVSALRVNSMNPVIDHHFKYLFLSYSIAAILRISLIISIQHIFQYFSTIHSKTPSFFKSLKRYFMILLLYDLLRLLSLLHKMVHSPHYSQYYFPL